jgi:hypothetical protein
LLLRTNHQATTKIRQHVAKNQSLAARRSSPHCVQRLKLHLPDVVFKVVVLLGRQVHPVHLAEQDVVIEPALSLYADVPLRLYVVQQPEGAPVFWPNFDNLIVVIGPAKAVALQFFVVWRRREQGARGAS